MSANKNVVSGFGFYVETKRIYDFDDQLKVKGFERQYVWTDKAREAKVFETKSAIAFINTLKNQNIDAFMWNPYKEEPIRDMYKVVRRTEYTSFYSEDKHKVLEWIVIKLKMANHTDAKFFANMMEKDYYPYDEAVEIAKQKNLEMLIELEEKMNKNNIIKQ